MTGINEFRLTGEIFLITSLSFEGTTKVINKGVVITLIADSDSVVLVLKYLEY